MAGHVLLREDDPDLASLVRELLEHEGYTVTVVTGVEDLLQEAARRAPCIALLDSSDPSRFDLWWLGPRLASMRVPPVAFTAHLSALSEFEQDPHGFSAVVAKPFDADDLIATVNAVCLDGPDSAAAS